MSTIRGHFDGKVIILDEPANFALNEEVQISTRLPKPKIGNGTLGEIVAALDEANLRMTDEEAEHMIKVIEEEFEKIEPWPDVRI